MAIRPPGNTVGGEAGQERAPGLRSMSAGSNCAVGPGKDCIDGTLEAEAFGGHRMSECGLQQECPDQRPRAYGGPSQVVERLVARHVLAANLIVHADPSVGYHWGESTGNRFSGNAYTGDLPAGLPFDPQGLTADPRLPSSTPARLDRPAMIEASTPSVDSPLRGVATALAGQAALDFAGRPVRRHSRFSALSVSEDPSTSQP